VKITTIVICIAGPLIPRKNPPKTRGSVFSFEYPAGTPPKALKTMPLNAIESERIRTKIVGLIRELKTKEIKIRQVTIAEEILTPLATVKLVPKTSILSIREIGV
jgi:hypothetical protein